MKFHLRRDDGQIFEFQDMGHARSLMASEPDKWEVAYPDQEYAVVQPDEEGETTIRFHRGADIPELFASSPGLVRL